MAKTPYQKKTAKQQKKPKKRVLLKLTGFILAIALVLGALSFGLYALTTNNSITFNSYTNYLANVLLVEEIVEDRDVKITQLNASEAARTTLTNEKTALEEAIVVKDAAILAKDAEITANNAAILALQNANDDQEVEIAALESANAILQAEKLDLEDERDDLTADLQTVNGQLDTANASILTLQNEIDLLDAQILDLQAYIVTLEANQLTQEQLDYIAALEAATQSTLYLQGQELGTYSSVYYTDAITVDTADTSLFPQGFKLTATLTDLGNGDYRINGEWDGLLTDQLFESTYWTDPNWGTEPVGWTFLDNSIQGQLSIGGNVQGYGFATDPSEVVSFITPENYGQSIVSNQVWMFNLQNNVQLLLPFDIELTFVQEEIISTLTIMGQDAGSFNSAFVDDTVYLENGLDGDFLLIQNEDGDFSFSGGWTYNDVYNELLIEDLFAYSPNIAFSVVRQTLMTADAFLFDTYIYGYLDAETLFYEYYSPLNNPVLNPGIYPVTNSFVIELENGVIVIIPFNYVIEIQSNYVEEQGVAEVSNFSILGQEQSFNINDYVEGYPVEIGEFNITNGIIVDLGYGLYEFTSDQFNFTMDAAGLSGDETAVLFYEMLLNNANVVGDIEYYGYAWMDAESFAFSLKAAINTLNYGSVGSGGQWVTVGLLNGVEIGFRLNLDYMFYQAIQDARALTDVNVQFLGLDMDFVNYNEHFFEVNIDYYEADGIADISIIYTNSTQELYFQQQIPEYSSFAWEVTNGSAPFSGLWSYDYWGPQTDSVTLYNALVDAKNSGQQQVIGESRINLYLNLERYVAGSNITVPVIVSYTVNFN